MLIISQIHCDQVNLDSAEQGRTSCMRRSRWLKLGDYEFYQSHFIHLAKKIAEHAIIVAESFVLIHESTDIIFSQKLCGRESQNSGAVMATAN